MGTICFTFKANTKISEVNLFAVMYRLFQEDFSSIIGTNTARNTVKALNYVLHLDLVVNKLVYKVELAC